MLRSGEGTAELIREGLRIRSEQMCSELFKSVPFRQGTKPLQGRCIMNYLNEVNKRGCGGRVGGGWRADNRTYASTNSETISRRSFCSVRANLEFWSSREAVFFSSVSTL